MSGTCVGIMWMAGELEYGKNGNILLKLDVHLLYWYVSIRAAPLANSFRRTNCFINRSTHE
jgi:hypothetical protein